MVNYSEYARTDLAAESGCVTQKTPSPGVKVRTSSTRGTTTLDVCITDGRGEKAVGKPVGNYVTISFGPLWQEEPPHIRGSNSAEAGAHTENEVVVEIMKTLSRLINEKVRGKKRVLVAGIGNREFTADSIGPLCCEEIRVTSHLADEETGIPLSAFCPGVAGNTGIESAELIKGAVTASRANVVIAVDCLASKSVDRLMRTVQISDTGITPGSGIGNRRHSVGEENIGVPVIAVGVPTIVDSSTLIYDLLEKSGAEIDRRLSEILENNRSFFVTPKDCDAAAKKLASIVAAAINLYAISEYESKNQNININ